MAHLSDINLISQHSKPMTETAQADHVPRKAGTFAVLTFDPIASVAHINDPEVTAACSKLTPKNYIVYVDEPNEYHGEESCFFVMSEEYEDPEKCIEPRMIIPIAPQSGEIGDEDHPSNREPLKTTTPFPFEDCFMSTFSRVVVRRSESDKHTVNDSKALCQLDEAEHRRLISFANEDDDDREELKDWRGCFPIDELARFTADFETWMFSHEPGTCSGRFDGEFVGLAFDMRVPVASLNYDLSSIDKFHDPIYYWMEIYQIHKAVEASIARKEAAERHSEDAFWEKQMALKETEESTTGSSLKKSWRVTVSPHRRRILRTASRGLNACRALLRRMMCLS
ncbi:hypothetical protein MIND_01359100 [Mycena indigotica]|uniref:Uncharacterized protein n=1 Tax=Mycena indigotica TaxID=2126181 RepID=A0A8H6VQ08_9AGAR|nr:uncharacterized protein MIND_01359100 [Mycena indigotica]KAF7289847.1 hypothetical protein MIND_01359100 [Mycena indigotica]